jgi:hypothetical protein
MKGRIVMNDAELGRLTALVLLGKADDDEKALYTKLKLGGATSVPTTPVYEQPMSGAELDAFRAEQGRAFALANGRAR